jgi:hypothetical protein
MIARADSGKNAGLHRTKQGCPQLQEGKYTCDRPGIESIISLCSIIYIRQRFSASINDLSGGEMNSSELLMFASICHCQL